MSRWSWNGDIDHFLAGLPKPLFRQRDAYTRADQLGIDRWQGQSVWVKLVSTGRIVRTTVPIGRATKRFYWERSNCSIRVSDENRRFIQGLVRYVPAHADTKKGQL